MVPGANVVLEDEEGGRVSADEVDDEESGVQATIVSKNAPIMTWRDFTLEG